jgi:hypothetical protein
MQSGATLNTIPRSHVSYICEGRLLVHFLFCESVAVRMIWEKVFYPAEKFFKTNGFYPNFVTIGAARTKKRFTDKRIWASLISSALHNTQICLVAKLLQPVTNTAHQDVVDFIGTLLGVHYLLTQWNSIRFDVNSLIYLLSNLNLLSRNVGLLWRKDFLNCEEETSNAFSAPLLIVVWNWFLRVRDKAVFH